LMCAAAASLGALASVADILTYEALICAAETSIGALANVADILT
jgi:hypothetical protein